MSPKPSETAARNREIEALVAELGPRIRRVCASYDMPRADADDLLQEALLALVRRWDEIRSPRYWLVGSVFNRCRDYWRRRRRPRGVSLVPVPRRALERLAGTTAGAQQGVGDRLDLAPLLANLPPRDRTIVLGAALGFSAQELGPPTGYGESSVRKRLATTRKTLRSRLAGAGRPSS